MQKPDELQIFDAFKAVKNNQDRQIQTILYMRPERFHNTKDPSGGGGSLIHAALDADSHSILQLLFKTKFPVNVYDNEGRSPLHIAKSSTIASMILQRAGDEGGLMLKDQDFKGNLPHHLMAKEGSKNAIAYLLQVTPNRDSMLMTKNQDGNTVLHCIAENIPSLIPALLSGRVDIRAKNEKGQSVKDVCSDNKIKRLLEIHEIIANRADNSAREAILQERKHSESTEAARRALDFVALAQSAEKFSIKPS